MNFSFYYVILYLNLEGEFVMVFVEDYKDWDNLSHDKKVLAVTNCVRFYEAKTVEYIVNNLSKEKKKGFKASPVKVEFVKLQDRPVSFGKNIVFVNEDFSLPKKDLFFMVAQSTVCAVFANLFSTTASNPNKNTKFSMVANGFLASITNEFAVEQDFEKDMMQEFEAVLSNEMATEM